MSDQSSNRPLAGKAVTYKALGGPEVIEIVERTVRAPAAGEVRIEVKAAAVNPIDILLRDPGFGGQTSLMVPGMDAAGIIESVGPGVSRLHAGEKVMAAVMPLRPEGGAQAQHIVVPAASVVPIPEGVSLAEASTLPMNGLTALNGLEIAALKKGQTLAVSGGAGLVAHYAIAAAKQRGIKVIADAKPVDAELVRGYGADIVVERGPGFAEAIRREVPNGADALLDTAVLGEKSFGAIRDGGIYIPVRGWGDKPAERGIEIKPMRVSDVLERTEWLELLRDLVAAAKIKLRVVGIRTRADRRCTARSRSRRPSWSAGNPVLATLPPCRPGHSAVQFRCGANRMEVIAMSDLETNKAIALRLVEVFNGRQLDRLEDVLHPKFRGRGISTVVPGGPEVGPGARRKLYQMFLQAIPDARGQVVDVVAEGDKVVLVDRFGGTHRGEFFGRPGTGNHIEWTAIHIYTIRDGKILEDAVMTDSLAIMQQIGLARKAWPATKQAEKY